jgi:hypothetical protein
LALILARQPFHLVALGTHGKVLLKKKFTQRQLITFTANPGWRCEPAHSAS